MHAVLVPVYLLILIPITLSWWASGYLVTDPVAICSKSRRLRGKMAEHCKSSDLLEHITKGVRLGQGECQHQFRDRHWNCTTAKRSIKKVVLRDTRETAFVNAILAAGITYQVTKACSLGQILGCPCVKMKKKKKGFKMEEGDWEWEGCGGENIDYGLKVSKRFLDTRYRKRSDMKTLVKLHNYVAGRMAIRNHMRTDCKCHGLSGSCTLKTCFRKMPSFREVGNRLKERFDGAAKVIAGNDGHSFMPEDASIKPPGKIDLVYSEQSLSFCNPNATIGSLGTQGRSCNATSQAEEGCSILCCARGAVSATITEEKECKCKFLWCCHVKCERCNETRSVSTCV